MKLPRFSLRELFLLVVIAAMGCLIATNVSNPITPVLVKIATELILVVAASAVGGRYVQKAPFAAGVVIGICVSLVLAEPRESNLGYLLRDWIIPSGTKDSYRIVGSVVHAAVLLNGLAGGVTAMCVARSHPN